ncbi:MAG: heme exporter protein CcmB [Gammaproteobacteria bacterium AqS3]|nr:heme exporter protein CcmB [Gammaproteobacteria bacterium AqS3]
MSPARQLGTALRSEWARHRSERYALWVVPGFYLIVLLLFGALLGPWPDLLARAAGAVVWSGASITLAACAGAMHRGALGDGSLQRWAASGRLMSLWSIGTIAVWGALCGAPLLVMGVLGMVSFAGWSPETEAVSLGLAIALPGLLGLASLASALGYGAGALLQPLLILPLMLPSLILGVGAGSVPGVLWWLGALSVGQLLLGVALSALTLRAQID